MAQAVQLIEPVSHRVAVGYQGFSWTCLFFGPFPALFRGHFLGFVVMFAAAFITFGLSGLIFMFVYNSWHYNWLMAKGFRPAGVVQQQFAPQHIINVSVGNVGTADHSQNAYLQPSASTPYLDNPASPQLSNETTLLPKR